MKLIILITVLIICKSFHFAVRYNRYKSSNYYRSTNIPIYQYVLIKD